MTECRNGYTYRNGKCSKRSNNPFKIWQSYIGAVIGLISFYLFIMSKGGENSDLYIKYGMFLKPLMETNSFLFLLAWWGIPIILGFILGYVLTILYRRIRK